MGAGARSCDAVVGSYDVVVVGGGVVGLASALALAAAGREVAVVERAPPRRRRGALGSDLRSVALTPASVEFSALDGRRFGTGVGPRLDNARLGT